MKVQRILLGILLLGLTIYGMVWGFTSHFSNLSKGDVIFQDEQSYITFKTELSSHMKDVIQWEASALTSAPPIVVKFKVETDLDYVFPYGDKLALGFILSHSTIGWDILFILFDGFLFILGLFLIANLLPIPPFPTPEQPPIKKTEF